MAQFERWPGVYVLRLSCVVVSAATTICRVNFMGRYIILHIPGELDVAHLTCIRNFPYKLLQEGGSSDFRTLKWILFSELHAFFIHEVRT